MSEAKLFKFLSDNIYDPLAMPKRIGIRSELPVTPVGKVFKPALRREAIHWAIDAVANQLNLSVEDISVNVSETLETEIIAPVTMLETLRKKTAGMPISIDFSARRSMP